MGRTPVPNATRSVAPAYAAMTKDASRALGSWVTQTDSHPSFSANLTLSTEASRVFTASMETARRATSSAIYSRDVAPGAVHGTTAGSHRAVPGFVARACGADPQPAEMELQAIRSHFSAIPGAAPHRHRHRFAGPLPVRVGRHHPGLFCSSHSRTDSDGHRTPRDAAAGRNDSGRG